MKTTKQLTFLLILFLCVCVISMPALSGEHPWDSDDDGGLDDIPDTSIVIVPKYNDQQGFSAVSNSSTTGWIFDIVTSISTTYTVWYYDLNSHDELLKVERQQHKKVVKRDSKKIYR